MLNIIIPGNNISEREYIVKTLLTDYLGLNYNIIISNSNQYYSIRFDDNELIIRDYFFVYFQMINHIFP